MGGKNVVVRGIFGAANRGNNRGRGGYHSRQNTTLKTSRKTRVEGDDVPGGDSKQRRNSMLLVRKIEGSYDSKKICGSYGLERAGGREKTAFYRGNVFESERGRRGDRKNCVDIEYGLIRKRGRIWGELDRGFLGETSKLGEVEKSKGNYNSTVTKQRGGGRRRKRGVSSFPKPPLMKEVNGQESGYGRGHSLTRSFTF